MTVPPRVWDNALEDLLDARTYDANIRWTDRVLNRVANAKTFQEAINRPLRPPRVVRSGAPSEDPSHARENHVRHMILAPLSPRKPVIIPCPYAAVKQRDKQKLEKIMRHRKAGLGRISIPEKEKENVNHVRSPEVVMRTFSSMASTKRVFYWGA
jgi:hypothetical protein